MGILADIREIADWIRLQRQLERMSANAKFLEWQGNKFNGGLSQPLAGVISRHGLDGALQIYRRFEKGEK